MSKIQKLRLAFKKGDVLTSPQIRARFGLANPRAAVARLPYVYSMREENSRGKVVTKYYGV